MERESQFELLRIVSMLFIVIGHFLIRIDIAGYFAPYSLSASNVIYTLIYSSVIIGVNLFVLITGYFGIHKIINPSLRLFIDCIIYGAVALFIRENCFKSTYMGGVMTALSFRSWWFVYSYILLIFISPVLEKCLKNIEYTDLRKIVVLLTFVVAYFCWFKGYDITNGYNVYFFVYLYVCGRFIKISCEKKWYNFLARNGLYLWLFFSIAILGLFLIIMLMSPWNSSHAYKIFAYDNPLIVMSAVSFFIFFSRIKIKSKLINKLATATFGIYLLHAGPALGGDLWTNGSISNIYHQYGIISLIVLIAGVFLGCMLISLMIEEIKTYTKLNYFLTKLSLLVSKSGNKLLNRL